MDNVKGVVGARGLVPGCTARVAPWITLLRVTPKVALPA